MATNFRRTNEILDRLKAIKKYFHLVSLWDFHDFSSMFQKKGFFLSVLTMNNKGRLFYKSVIDYAGRVQLRDPWIQYSSQSFNTLTDDCIHSRDWILEQVVNEAL